MKAKILFFFLGVFILQALSPLKAQTTAIPDAKFEYYLETHDANGIEVGIGDDTSMGDGIDNNGLVLSNKIDNVIALNVGNLNLNTLSGIEDFLGLETLICSGNNLIDIDVSNNENLKSLLCGSNQLTGLIVNANTNLEDLDCSNNQILNIDIRDNVLIRSVNCSNNRISTIDLSQNPDLTSLSISNNRITNLDVDANTNLQSLYCASNQLTTLDLLFNNSLSILDVSNNALTNLDLSAINTVVCPDQQTDPITICQGPSTLNVSNNQLTSLVVSNEFNDLVTSFNSEGNIDLSCIQIDVGFAVDANWIKDDWTYFSETTCAAIYTYVPDDNFEQALIDLALDDVLDNLVLTSNIVAVNNLDVSNLNIDTLLGIEDFTGLTTLNCGGNNILELDISNNILLTNLDASGNNLEHLDLSANTAITVLNISNNNLSSIDITTNVSLENLNCSNNAIQLLDLNNHPSITDFNCESNALEVLNIQNGQNGNLTNFTAVNNPNLTCIETDTGGVPGGVNWVIDATANYATNCGTYVPDGNFEQALIDLGYDVAPLDNYVPTGNILGVTDLDISGRDIADVTGIQDFDALQTFNCANNAIVELNLVANMLLTSINCNNNALEFVDIRNGNNASITFFDATINSSLFCINVDAAVIGNIPAGWTIDPISNYNSDCDTNRFTPIPDDNFEQALIDLGIDAGPLDNQVLTANIEYLTSLSVSGKNIESLEGIQAFLSLTELDCSDNFLDELDVSGMVNLENLFCGSNFFLTTNTTNPNGVLNISGTPNLTKLFCPDNNLADLDISLHTNLEILECSNNKLGGIDISNNTNLIEVICDNNQISNFVSYAADNSTLITISCNNNELSTLQVNRCLALTTLNCRSNALSLLDIGANTALEVLDFSDNELADINLSANSNLIALSGSQNQLTEVDDLSSVVLESLILDNNQISQLNTVLNSLPSLKHLSVSSNALTDLNTSINVSLIELNVSNNAITSLELASNLNQLKNFNCSNNGIDGGMDLSTLGTGACPAQNLNNPLDFCPDTITINVSGNQIEFVSIQNGINSEISNFSATNNPNLNCIQVDDENNVGASWIKDITAVYSIDCKFGETYVPDDNFEQALIDLGYDIAPLDDYVPTIIIEVVTDLDISGNNITDLTGIEDFTALRVFNCSNNTISTIDVGSNINLTEINCSNNTLTHLDLTNNTGVVSVDISNNDFTEFDVSLIPALEVLDCNQNEIVELDFTTNPTLTNLNCASNALEVLNLQNGQNGNLTNLNAQNNIDLTCIQTDDGTVPAGVTWLKDATTQYAINCHFGETYVPDDNFEQALIDLGYDTAPLDDYVPTVNIKNRQSLDVESKSILDLTGIEDFEALTTLSFSNNLIEAVDLSNNVKLVGVDASGNQLTDLETSSLLDLNYLNIAGNNFTQINTASNLGLIDLNIADNRFETLDVSLLLDLEKLNCSFNLLAELDFTSNTKLTELICISNLLFQDKLNIQNGANETLRIFNASDNPDLSCILVDDPVAVISNVDGLYDNWFKDATTNYQTVCDDADNDGVANEDDLCPGTPFGEPVDLFGCTFSALPEDNFTILITSETCLNNNDGKIRITTKEFYQYKAHLVGDDFDREYSFTNEIDILNLLAGTYRLCMTSDELPNFERCFDVVINHPENLDVITGKSKKGKEVTFTMSGSSNYNIDFNGLQFSTTDSSITLQLEQGENTIKISTDLPCQGFHEESILLSDEMLVYPNPFQEDINIYLGEMDSDIVEIQVFSYIGQMVLNRQIEWRDKRSVTINTQHFKTGLYTVIITSKNSISNFKIVKK
ncbi:T9SS type A sorting domain-containing protein [Hyunsoonleella ulvae]|uniref:T9SS type A sorting domain-containing protein n=1 Tax=Hyunsoonleella ulvae TaxID=2799948 RepID=UPI00193A9C75|nr:T9SS type A sorting domain-containing protein [Hyunsoonleella ulvae]